MKRKLMLGLLSLAMVLNVVSPMSVMAAEPIDDDAIIPQETELTEFDKPIVIDGDEINRETDQAEEVYFIRFEGQAKKWKEDLYDLKNIYAAVDARAHGYKIDEKDPSYVKSSKLEGYSDEAGNYSFDHQVFTKKKEGKKVTINIVTTKYKEVADDIEKLLVEAGIEEYECLPTYRVEFDVSYTGLRWTMKNNEKIPNATQNYTLALNDVQIVDEKMTIPKGKEFDSENGYLVLNDAKSFADFVYWSESGVNKNKDESTKYTKHFIVYDDQYISDNSINVIRNSVISASTSLGLTCNSKRVDTFLETGFDSLDAYAAGDIIDIEKDFEIVEEIEDKVSEPSESE